MAILQPNCNCQKASKAPITDLEPKWLFYSQIVMARRHFGGNLPKQAFLKPGTCEQIILGLGLLPLLVTLAYASQ